MEYHGKLYGKIGRKYFDTGVSTKEFDKLTKEHKEMLEMLKILVNDFREADLMIISIENIEKAEQLIKEATEL